MGIGENEETIQFYIFFMCHMKYAKSLIRTIKYMIHAVVRS